MVIVVGVPKRAILPLKKASATVSARRSTSGMASGQRVKQVSRYLKPSAYGRGPRGPTISIYMYVVRSFSRFCEFAENWLIMARYFGGLATFARTASFSDIYVHSVTDEPCIDQRLCSPMRWMTDPCKVEKTCFQNFGVIYGRMCRVDTSHQMELLSNDLSN